MQEDPILHIHIYQFFTLKVALSSTWKNVHHWESKVEVEEPSSTTLFIPDIGRFLSMLFVVSIKGKKCYSYALAGVSASQSYSTWPRKPVMRRLQGKIRMEWGWRALASISCMTKAVCLACLPSECVLTVTLFSQDSFVPNVTLRQPPQFLRLKI